MKKKIVTNIPNNNISSKENELTKKIEELNQDYIDLIKKFKMIEKEKICLQKVIDE